MMTLRRVFAGSALVVFGVLVLAGAAEVETSSIESLIRVVIGSVALLGGLDLRNPR